MINHIFLCLSVKELGSFIENTEIGLARTVNDGDYDQLVDVMGHLMAIRDRQLSTEQHFKPLEATSNLLKTYNQQLPEHVYILLEVTSLTCIWFCYFSVHATASHTCVVSQSLPEKWKNLKKVAFTVKHEVAPLQSNEVAVIRRKCVQFEVRGWTQNHQHQWVIQFWNIYRYLAG